jgi:hypothetical protein
MSMPRIAAGVALVLSFALVLKAQDQKPAEFSLYENEVSFSGSGQERPLPDMRLFQDATNNAVGLQCMRRSPISDLKKLGIPDLERRLDALTKGNAIVLRDSNCSLTFPIIVGPQRDRLQDLVQPVAAKLAPRVAKFADRIRAAVPDYGDMVFHLLWSRVVDDVWDQAWKESFSSSGPPDSTWVIYPQQRFTVGTNYNSIPGNGSSALTWAPDFRRHIGPVSDSLIDASRMAWGKEVSADDMARLQELGFVDSSQKLKVFVYHSGDRVDTLLKELTTEYAAALAGVYEYAAVGKKFGLPPEQMFLVLLHETAYAVFDDLSRSGELQIPKVLTGSGEMRDAVRLVSLAIAEPPGAEDDAMYTLIKNGWRGSAETAVKFREVVDKDPNKSDDWLYLGMSLYEIKDYRAAVDAFQKCAEHAAKDSTLSEWAVIWEAQMHDLLGERENALRLYRSVAESKNTATMMFGQYRIGPISAREWARQRIESPFTRR